MPKTKVESAYIYAFAYSVLAYLSLVIGTFTAPMIFNNLDICEAFGRAGAIMVLFCMIAEFYIHTAWGGNLPAGAQPNVTDIPADENKHRKRVSCLRPWTNTGAIIGTVIWAYGDLILKSLCA